SLVPTTHNKNSAGALASDGGLGDKLGEAYRGWCGSSRLTDGGAFGAGLQLFFELGEQALGARGEGARHFDLHLNVEGASPAAVDARSALALQRDDVTGLRAGWNVDRELGVVEKRDGDGGAERRFGERNARARGQVDAVALEALVGLELDVDVEVA